MAIGYAKVKVNITAFVVDGIDSDDLPDDRPLTAKLTLTPMIQAGRMLQYMDDGVAKLKAVSSITVDIGSDGSIDHQSRDFVKVVAPTIVETNLARLQWRARFTDIRLGGVTSGVAIDDIYFWVDPGVDINIADHVNVAASTAVQISRGAQGFGVSTVFVNEDGDLVVGWESPDGVVESDPIPFSTVVSDGTVASLVGDSGSATKTALDTTYASKASTAKAWQASTAYATNAPVFLPNGKPAIRTAAGTSRSTFDSTEEALWTATAGGTTTVEGLTDVTTLGKAVAKATSATTARAALDAMSLGEVSVVAAPIPANYGAPVTITPTAISTSTITDAVLVARTDAALRYEGLASLGDTGTFYYFKRLTGSAAGTASNPWLVAFDYDGLEFEIKGWTPTSPRGEYRLWVNGQPESQSLAALAASGAHAIKVQFPSAQRRRIVLELGSGFNFGGIWRPPTANVLTSTIPTAPKKLAVLGDSLVWGAGIVASGQQALGFTSLLGRLLGWNVANLGIGGTGWATDVTTGVTAVRFSQRLADLYTAAPDVILIPGSQNDKNAAAGAINSEVVASIAAIKTNLPSAKIVLASTLFPATPTSARGGFDVTRRAVMDAEVKAAVDATTGVTYLDTSSWFNGTGRVGTPDGGNADWFRTSLDWSHPSAEGHAYLARRFAPELRRIVGA